jgi:hypothetical protein
LNVVKLTNDEFKAYGRVLTGYDVTELINVLKKTDAPTDSVIYIPSVEEFEKLPIGTKIRDSFFGGLPTQIGYCNGTNHQLNAVEYHRCSEFCIAGSDLVVLVGRQQDVAADFTYDSSKMEAFFVPEGTVFEMFSTTLHYAPISCGGKPFRNIVSLLKDTNTALVPRELHMAEDKLMTAKNKWLIAHADANIDGAFVGILGENIMI